MERKTAGAGSSPADRKSQSLQERLRIAERIAQALREAGYSCELGDDDHPRAPKLAN
jgi:menaquinone-dependent protoporphyrinogen IX oxidase